MNIVLVGLGGDGVVIAGRILARSAMKQGLDIRVGETHGLAQRGGTVISHLRIGDDAKGVIIPKGKGDVIVGFEPLETLRQLPLLKEHGEIIMNLDPRLSYDFYSGKAQYPSLEEISRQLRNKTKLSSLQATKIAVELGSSKFTNIVMLGALTGSGLLPVDRKVLLDTIEQSVPPHTVEKNIKAFEAGEVAYKTSQDHQQ
ncbi:MAG TPA: indolepyruvate ferredoxin oxidoreductase subunit beta [Euryarchaeota archaeon]|nr:indolepyruvate ferredoxin oxidoreductase subunit beta [Euryarchaeota archaeon]